MTELLCLFFLLSLNSCAQSQSSSVPEVERIVIDPTDEEYGYYLAVRPEGNIQGVLLLLPGFGQRSESVFEDTNFHQVAADKHLLTVAFAGRTKLTADSTMRAKLDAVLGDLVKSTGLGKDKFILGGFSAGGVIALRYTELCHQFPESAPVQPVGVFLADAPVDLFHSWKLQEENLANNRSELAVGEAKWIARYYREYYGATPGEDPEVFIPLSPFSIDTTYGTNERFLRDVAVRSYHDIDVAWRLVNRNQAATYDNFVGASELINRLLLLGNERAEFIQTFRTGYRPNGNRHPHSWSIVEEGECVDWVLGLLR